MRYVAGAYPAAPPDDPWNSRDDAEFLDAVLASPLVGGLEIPYLFGRLHRADERWLLDRLPAGGRHVITTVPTTVTQVGKDRSYGLASVEESGRRAALSDAAGARDAVERLVQWMGEAAVRRTRWNRPRYWTRRRPYSGAAGRGAVPEPGPARSRPRGQPAAMRPTAATAPSMPKT